MKIDDGRSEERVPSRSGRQHRSTGYVGGGGGKKDGQVIGEWWAECVGGGSVRVFTISGQTEQPLQPEHLTSLFFVHRYGRR